MLCIFLYENRIKISHIIWTDIVGVELHVESYSVDSVDGAASFIVKADGAKLMNCTKMAPQFSDIQKLTSVKTLHKYGAKQMFTMILRLETGKRRKCSQKLAFQAFASLSGSWWETKICRLLLENRAHIKATAVKYSFKCEKYMKARCMKSVCYQKLQASSLGVIPLIRRYLHAKNWNVSSCLGKESREG